MNVAASLLGAESYYGGVSDGTLADDRPTRLLLTEIYRRFQPSLVLAHAPTDYHADHRAAGALAEVASWFCASRGQKTKSPPLPAAPALWWMDTVNMSGFEPGFYVDISAFMAVKEKMLGCHRSQMARATTVASRRYLTLCACKRKPAARRPESRQPKLSVPILGINARELG